MILDGGVNPRKHEPVEHNYSGPGKANKKKDIDTYLSNQKGHGFNKKSRLLPKQSTKHGPGLAVVHIGIKFLSNLVSSNLTVRTVHGNTV